MKLYDSYASMGILASLVWLPGSTLSLIRFLKRQRCRCVIASTPAPFVPFQGVVASKILNIPFVLDVRDSWEIESVTHEGAVRNRVKESLERLCARSADRVWFVTSLLLERLRAKYGLEPGHLLLVPNGADLQQFGPSDRPRPVDLVFLGSPARYRNVNAVMRSVAELKRARPSVRAQFMGWAGAPNEDAIRSLVIELGLKENVELAPAVPRSEVSRALAKARLGIVSFSEEPSLRGAIGAKAYEYIACGIPLACLGPEGDSELRRLVETGPLGFYASNPEEFAAAAEELLGDEVRWGQYSGNCISTSKAFDRQEICERALRDSVIPLLTISGGG